MSDTEVTLPVAGKVNKTETWSESRPTKKDAEYYPSQRKKYKEFMKGNEFLKLPELDAVNTRTISLLTTSV